jgi:predicted RNase H-like HicB family nuclease
VFVVGWLGVHHPAMLASCKEALANVEIIIQEWIETAKELGRPIPAPRGRLAFA